MWTNGAELAVVFFTICNTMRAFAYLPQLVRVLRDREGAAAISCPAWFLFSLANASTVIYAGFVLHDRITTTIFLINTLFSSAVLVATLLQRRTRRSANWSRWKCADASTAEWRRR
jgi:uncharacterized protein with PQ loop repeat